MKKYYTPKIEEFCVRFECQAFSHLSGGWKDWTVDVFGLQQLLNESIEDSLDLGHYRVKHLDEKGIRDFGWDKDITYQNQDEVVFMFGGIIGGLKKCHHLTYYLSYYDETLVIRLYNADNEKNTVFEVDGRFVILPIFIGSCKNKSRLKQIMEWTGII